MKKIFLLALTTLLIIAANAQDTTQRMEYLGKYKFPEGSVVPEVEVLIENGMLMMNSTAGTSALELIKGDTFTIVAFNGTAAFKRNDAKKVIAVHIDAGGYVLDGLKDSTATIANIVHANLNKFPVFSTTYVKPGYLTDFPADKENVLFKTAILAIAKRKD